MNDTIKVICENGFGELEVPMGTPLLEVAERLTPGLHPFLAAFVNNRIKELNYKIYAPVTIRFVDITSFAGIRVYQRTAWFLLQKAVKDLYPGQTLHIRHSMGQSGFYCEIDGIDEFTPDEAAQLRDRMRELSVRNLPITRQRMLTTEVRARYAEEGFTDKIALLDTRPRLYSQLYTLDDTAGYFYGWPPRRAMSRCSTSNPTTTAFTWPFRCARRPTRFTATSIRRRCSASSRSTSRGSGSWAFPPSATSIRRCSRATAAA